MIKNLICWHRV